jgi:hypothetical protein
MLSPCDFVPLSFYNEGITIKPIACSYGPICDCDDDESDIYEESDTNEESDPYEESDSDTDNYYFSRRKQRSSSYRKQRSSSYRKQRYSYPCHCEYMYSSFPNKTAVVERDFDVNTKDGEQTNLLYRFYTTLYDTTGNPIPESICRKDVNLEKFFSACKVTITYKELCNFVCNGINTKHIVRVQLSNLCGTGCECHYCDEDCKCAICRSSSLEQSMYYDVCYSTLPR